MEAVNDGRAHLHRLPVSRRDDRNRQENQPSQEENQRKRHEEHGRDQVPVWAKIFHALRPVQPDIAEVMQALRQNSTESQAQISPKMSHKTEPKHRRKSTGI